ncbi:TPA: hypothetical protein ACVU4T_004644, partial [Vibrio parahaemolyticus]
NNTVEWSKDPVTTDAFDLVDNDLDGHVDTLKAVKAGSGSVKATSSGISGTSGLITVDNATITDMAISPDIETLPVGFSQTFEAFAVADTGANAKLNEDQVSWTVTSDVGVSGTDNGDGTYTVESKGTGVDVTVTASLNAGAFPDVGGNDLSKEETFTTVPADITNLVVEPLDGRTVVVGVPYRLRAEAVQANGELFDATDKVDWGATSTGDYDIAADGLTITFKADASESVTLTATPNDDSFGEYATPATSTVTVLKPEVQGIIVTPPEKTIGTEESTELKAYAYYSYGKEPLDVTESVTWSVELAEGESDTYGVTVEVGSGVATVTSSTQAGVVNVTATDGAGNSNFSIVTVELSVKKGVLTPPDIGGGEGNGIDGTPIQGFGTMVALSSNSDFAAILAYDEDLKKDNSYIYLYKKNADGEYLYDERYINLQTPYNAESVDIELSGGDISIVKQLYISDSGNQVAFGNRRKQGFLFDYNVGDWVATYIGSVYNSGGFTDAFGDVSSNIALSSDGNTALTLTGSVNSNVIFNYYQRNDTNHLFEPAESQEYGTFESGYGEDDWERNIYGITSDPAEGFLLSSKKLNAVALTGPGDYRVVVSDESASYNIFANNGIVGRLDGFYNIDNGASIFEFSSLTPDEFNGVNILDNDSQPLGTCDMSFDREVLFALPYVDGGFFMTTKTEGNGGSNSITLSERSSVDFEFEGCDGSRSWEVVSSTFTQGRDFKKVSSGTETDESDYISVVDGDLKGYSSAISGSDMIISSPGAGSNGEVEWIDLSTIP